MTPVQIAQDIVRIDTRNPPGRELECARYLGEMLAGAGFEVDYLEFDEARTSVVARLSGRGEKPSLCFAGHIDVVPLGNQVWTVEPFGAEIIDGKLYGRGTSDMKAGIAAFTHMGLALSKLPAGAADIVLVITAGEETGCEGSKHLSDAGVVENVGAIVIAEPTSNYPILGHRGALWLKVMAEGVTAHGSMPELGDNAIYKAARATTKLEGLGFNVLRDDLLGTTTLNVGTISGGLNINSVPDAAELTVDIRTIPGHQHTEILSTLEAVLGSEVQISPVVDVGGVMSNRDDPWIENVFQLMEGRLGEMPAPRGAPYFTDASVLTPAFGNPPTIILGPGEMALAHQTDEYCYVNRIEEASQIYLDIACRWCGI